MADIFTNISSGLDQVSDTLTGTTAVVPSTTYELSDDDVRRKKIASAIIMGSMLILGVVIVYQIRK
jgi:hypothetical protein